MDLTDVDLTVHDTDIWWNMLIKCSTQIGNSFAKIINAKLNSRPYQTVEMQLFPHIVTGFRGRLRFLPYICNGDFAKIVKNKKPFTIFAKTSILNENNFTEN